MISTWFPTLAFFAIMYACWAIGRTIEVADKRAREQRAEIIRQLDRIASKMESHYSLMGAINTAVRGGSDEPSWWDSITRGDTAPDQTPE